MSGSSCLKNSSGQRKRVKTSAAALISAIDNELFEVARKIKALGGDEENEEKEVVAMKEGLRKKWSTLNEKLPALRDLLAKEEEDEREGNSVSPSQLHAENLERARGTFHICDRDSGIARHSLFYKVAKYLNGSTDSSFGQSKDDKWNMLAKSIEALEGGKWDALAVSIQAAASKNKLHSNEPRDLQGREACYSEELTRCLSKFSSRNNLPFLFSHQLACKANSVKEDCADMAAFYTGNDGRDHLLGLVEVKKVPDGKAKWQLCCYFSEAFESKILDREQRISFGLTIDQEKINLYGFCWGNGEGELLEHSLLWSAILMQKNHANILKAYFKCLAVLSNPAVREAAPSKNYCPLVTEEVFYNSRKVFHNKTKTTMYKLFDYGKFRAETRQVNREAIEVAYKGKVDCSVDVKECEFGLLSVLVTPWFHGGHKPTCPEHIAKLCDQLQLLHDEGKKHNDVLCQNVIFGYSQGGVPTANLIDFDYAHLPDYPESWNTMFPERHPKSYDGQPTCSSHDVYAAIAILCIHFTCSDEFTDGAFTKDKHPNLKEKWEKASAAEVRKWILTNKESLVPNTQPTHEVVHQQTGSPP